MNELDGISDERLLSALKIPLDKRSIALRELSLRALAGGERGHIGSTMSLIEVLRVLYDDILNHRPEEPDWPERDRCILSKGHGCIALYAILVDHGYFPAELLDGFCRRGSPLGGHPERGKVPGVEASTGSLGHGFSIGVGMALSARIQKRESRIFVICGDGEINEGSVWEAAMGASKHKLGNLVLIVDYNKVQSAGPTKEILNMEPMTDKWRSFGFNVLEANGHDVNALKNHLQAIDFKADKPTALISHSVKGKGIDFAENDAAWHHKSSLKGPVLEKLKEAVARYPAL